MIISESCRRLKCVAIGEYPGSDETARSEN